ncbi:MAG: hypothetical protein IKN80_07995 [Clostridiales bacterium]|nr:hypothetical protein [Clostridiales bacterium]
MKRRNIAAFSLVFVLSLLYVSACGKPDSSSEGEVITTSSLQEISDISESTIETTEAELQSVNGIEGFVEAFNVSSDIDLVFVEDFTPSDQSSDHYRTEFRLNGYRDAVGKSYTFDDATVDIVYREPMYGDPCLRIYMIGSFEQCEDMIRIASPIMDTSITDEILQETIDYINGNYVGGHREANGYYYSDLGMTLFEDDDGSCSLLLKMRND